MERVKVNGQTDEEKKAKSHSLDQRRPFLFSPPPPGSQLAFAVLNSAFIRSDDGRSNVAASIQVQH